ncbi:hypothetical protein IJC60_00905 [bacterium]|nr:hypothetical protein [bacterium]
MFRIILSVFFFFLVNLTTFALDNDDLVKTQNIQERIDDCGYKILNANKIERRVVFAYDKNDVKFRYPNSVKNRKVVLYENDYQFISNNDELAAYLAREISLAIRSFDGVAGGFLRSLQVCASPKKFEIVADKRAVDYMVMAGYNPIGLITYIQKSSPQARQDLISNKNLTSKRLAIIYEYILTKYPYYLVHNPYIQTEAYQNFLLTSYKNRKLLEQKITSGSKKAVKYE